MPHNHIDIVGLGLVTGYGWGREVFWDGCAAASQRPDCSAVLGTKAPSPRGSRACRTAVIRPTETGCSAVRSWRRDGKQWRMPERGDGYRENGSGVLYAGCFNDMYAWREVSRGNARRSRDFVRAFPSTPTAMFMKEFGFHGPSFEVSATCSSSNNAMLTAKQWLDTGKADDVVVIAADLSFTPEVMAGFAGMGAAVVDVEPQDACRPFQEGGRGFPPGEAAVGFVLSSRTSDPYAAFLGGAMTSDGYHATGMDPSSCVR